MEIEVSSTGSFNETEKWLRRVSSLSVYDKLARFGEQGVAALAAATPKESGETARAWSYKIIKSQKKKTYSIVWTNSHRAGTAPVAILLQYGHATGTGGRVEGVDYINPAMKPIFDKMAKEAWRAVTQ